MKELYCPDVANICKAVEQANKEEELQQAAGHAQKVNVVADTLELSK